ncbi:Alpha/Beta hydrolase protein [Boletus edulis BED1]|uniref:Alpha/Beta hydrolase protein n=1 Tax=Boletus edulis BED1 TaxID=1328754 RepID=A0AAD4GL47_BOLED|nr:Alpha/Beta hydrolase protein [Boletus edulis BED1]
MMAASSSSLHLPIPPARDIPVTFSASLRSWWSAGEKQGAAAEERLLRRLPFFLPERMSTSVVDSSPVIARSERIELASSKHYLNVLSIKATNSSPTAPPPAVVLHGYGAGLGFFFRNFPTLATWAGDRSTNVYALDWLGMGRSARVPFRIKAKRDDIPGRVREAESFFVDSLEEWRAKMGIEKMTLVGHSLGAYFSVVYALRYPTRVHKLILLSPAGVPHNPDNLTMPSRELTDVSDLGSSASAPAEPASASEIRHIRHQQRAIKKQESRSQRLLTYLWEEGWSPFQVVRSALFWGPMLVGKYSSRRFSGLTEDETRDMHDYILNITLSRGSGEYCISHILAPYAHARMPLVDRVTALKIPITFVYGEHDWMDPVGGLQALENLRLAGNENGRMFVVPNAGHHVYLDNPTATNDLLVEELNRAD